MQAYNAEKYIRESIESILGQSVGDLEFILVNNASTDGTGEICRSYAAKDRRIKYQENEINTILHPEYEAQWIPPAGEYFSYLDSDDYLDPDYLKVMYRKAKKHEVDIIVGGTKMFLDGMPDQEKASIPPAMETTHMPALAEKFGELFGPLSTLWGKLFRTEFYLLHRAYAFDKPSCVINNADTFAMLRFLRKCRSFVAIDHALHHYRIHKNSLYQSKVSVERVKGCDYVYEEALELFKEWHALTPKGKNILANAHANFLKNCILIAAQNTSLPLADRLNVFQAVTSNDLFCSYATTDANRVMTFNLIGDIFKNLLRGLADSERMIAQSFYTVRIYSALDEIDQNGKTGFCATLLSGICDLENKHLWGIDCIKKFGLMMPANLRSAMGLSPDALPLLLKRPRLLREMVNGDMETARTILDSEEGAPTELRRILDSLHRPPAGPEMQIMDATKQRLATCVEEDALEEAIQLLAALLDARILDREGLYFKMYLAWKIGDTALAVDTAEIAAVFWDDDPDLLAMCGDIFAAAGIAERSERFYHRAIEISDDEPFRADIRERVEGLKKRGTDELLIG